MFAFWTKSGEKRSHRQRDAVPRWWVMDYIVPISGGKDSQAVLAIAIERHRSLGEKVIALHNWTGHDHPHTIKHLDYISKRYEVEIVMTHSKKYADVPDFISKAQYFPASNARGCTTALKIKPFIKWLRDSGYTKGDGLAHIYFGMRAAESTKRATKYSGIGNEEVFPYSDVAGIKNGKDLIYVTASLPILDWPTQKVFEFLRARGDKVNDLYGIGHGRVGCYPCVLAGRVEWELAVNDPFGRGQIKKFIDLQDRFAAEKNPRKLIKIHETRDVHYLYEHGRFPPHQRSGLDTSGGCGLFCEPEPEGKSV